MDEEKATPPATETPKPETPAPGGVWTAVKSTLENHAEPVLKVVGLLSLGWSIVVFFMAPNKFDLQVWVDKTEVLYPSRMTEKLSLPLTLDGAPVASADVLTIGIKNAGKEPIGALDRTWTLSISKPNASRLTVVGVLAKSPDNTKLTPVQTPDASDITFEVGILEPRSKIELLALATYASEETKHAPLKVHTSLPGLAVQESSERPERRIALKFVIPIWFALFVFVGIPDALQRWREGARHLPDAERERLEKERKRLDEVLKPRSAMSRFLRRALGMAGAMLCVAVLLAFGLGWVLSFFL